MADNSNTPFFSPGLQILQCQMAYLLAHIRFRRLLEGGEQVAVEEELQALASRWTTTKKQPTAGTADIAAVEARRTEYARLTTAATRIQAWWRGVNVRHRLAKVG